jgi:hypothetical protein
MRYLSWFRGLSGERLQSLSLGQTRRGYEKTRQESIEKVVCADCRYLYLGTSIRDYD